MLFVIAATDVSGWVTGLFALILIALIACLALEELLHAKKSIIAGSFAVLCLLLGAAFGILPFQKVAVGSYRAIEPDDPVEIRIQPDESSERTETVVIGGHDLPDAETDPDQPADHHELHVDGHRISMPVYIPGIDWSVIVIILGSSLFVEVTSRSGLFTWIAIRVTKLSGGDPLKLLYFYGVMTVVFSAVLNNVTAMIIVGSLTVVSLEKLDRNDKLPGFLLIEALLTNIGGLLTLISSVPNIIVGTTADISFMTFFIKSSPYVVMATFVTLLIGARLFGIRRLSTAEECEEARRQVEGFDENDGITSWRLFRFAVAMLILFIVLIAGTSALPVINKLGMGFVAASMATVMLILYRYEVDKFYKAVDWDLIGFFMALFVVIYVMEHAQVLQRMGQGLQMVLSDVRGDPATVADSAVLLIGSSIFSSVTDNIPLSAMMASILNQFETPNSSGLWWSVIFGCNLGGNLTPIGSASTLVAVTIMHKHQVSMSFGKFIRLAFPYAVAQIVLAVAYVALMLRG